MLRSLLSWEVGGSGGGWPGGGEAPRRCLLQFQVPAACEGNTASLLERGSSDSRQKELCRIAMRGDCEAAVAPGEALSPGARPIVVPGLAPAARGLRRCLGLSGGAGGARRCFARFGAPQLWVTTVLCPRSVQLEGASSCQRGRGGAWMRPGFGPPVHPDMACEALGTAAAGAEESPPRAVGTGPGGDRGCRAHAASSSVPSCTLFCPDVGRTYTAL